MLCGKDVFAWVVGGVMGTLCCGCAGPDRQLVENRGAPAPPTSEPRSTADSQPPPDLQTPPLPPPPPPVLPAAAREMAPVPAPPVRATQAPSDPGFPGAPPLAIDTVAQLRSLHRLAAERCAGMDSYIVRLRRREQVNGKQKPEEIILFKFRKQPWSVFLKWLSAEGKGREVVYVKGGYDNKIHTLLAAGDIPLMPAGKRLALAVDNPLVRSSSRHAITEAGIGALLERLEAAVAAFERGDARGGSFRYLGTLKRPEFELPGQAVEQSIPPGCEATLSRGGRRLWFFDALQGLPLLIVTQDETGQEVEYYCYDRLQYPVQLDDDDFNPEKLWNTGQPGTSREPR